MNEYTDIEAVLAINHYTWGLLKDKLSDIWTTIGATIPIVPAGEQPELADQKKPYITYGYSAEQSDTFVPMNREVVAYTVYGTNTQVTQTVSMLNKAFRRYDDSAMDINHFISTSPDLDQAVIDALADISIHYTEVLASQSPGPAASEGGKLDGLVVIRYSYARTHTENEFRL